MAERVVGLDVGTAAVRVADVEPGPRPVLRAFGHVDLPPGAVRGGEVVDPAAVAEAIRQLWRETGLRQRRARVGVASERVVVRTIELPSLSDAELAGALQYAAQDYVPFPVDESILDFHVLERIPGGEGEPVTRVLLAAAHRQTVDALLSAVKTAGVAVSAVDLVPLALIRGLGSAAGEPGAAEAIVSVGAGITTIVVHEAGLPRLVRIVATGEDAVTDAGVARIALPVHSSLDYYLNQTETAPLVRVLLTGGSLTPGLADSIGSSLGVPVEPARPRDMLDVGNIGVPESQLAELDPYLPVAVGLALGGPRAPGPQIDLLPPEARREEAARQATRRLALVAAVLLVVLAGMSLFQAAGAAGQRDRLADQQRTNRALQARVDELAGPQKVQQDLALARQRVGTALAGDVSWPRVLEDLAATLPPTVWLDSFSLQLTGGAGAGIGDAATTGTEAAAATAGGGPTGTATFTAKALDFPSVAAWLDRLPRLPYYLNVSVSSVSKAEGGTRPLVSFTSGATVGPALRSDRLQRLVESAL